MYDFIEGIVAFLDSNSVVICNNGIGYKVFTPNPYVFKENCTERVYLYNYIREDENSLYGFKTLEERELFLKLIGVKGLGPKVALPILATGTVSGVVDAIDRENLLYLKKFPKVGEKLAKQIILDLKGKLVSKTSEQESDEELVSVLMSLGYKTNDIKRVIKEVDNSLSIEQQVKQALKLLLK